VAVVHFGQCENCSNKDTILNPFVYHPNESVIAYVCVACHVSFADALERKQLPSLLGDKIQAALSVKP